MNLTEILKAGQVLGELKPVTVEWESTIDGKTYTADIFVKGISYGAQLEVRGNMESGETDTRTLVILAGCRFGENGEEKLTYEQVQNLDSNLVLALYNAVEKSIGMAGKKKTESRPKKNSGAKSSSRGSTKA